MWLIVLCSVVAWESSLSGCFTCTGLDCRGRSAPRPVQHPAQRRLCRGPPGVRDHARPVARVAHAVILRHSRPRTELREIAEEAGQLEVPKLERNLPLLATIAYGTPLLGLLGTLLGLLSAFETIAAQSGYATAADIADGVYLSLLTSASSLAVAIPPSSPTVISQPG